MIRFRHSAALLLGCSLFLSGCGVSSWFDGARVRNVKTVAKPPADVTLFVTVSDHGEPVGGLAETNFKIYEDDVLLNSNEISLRLLSRNEISDGFTVLLIDLSGNPSETELKRIQRGAAHFVEKVTTTQPVTIVAFDGTARAREVARYSKVDAPTSRDVPALQAFVSEDSSRDLNNALLGAIKGVEMELAKSGKKGTFGTVVTMTRGPDLAGRRPEDEVKRAINSSKFEFYSLTPSGRQIRQLGLLGRDAQFEFDTIDTLPMRFQDLGMRVRDAWNSHYLVNYCSPSRAGERKVKVKVSFDGGSGGSQKSGSDSDKFDATGFEAGCGKSADSETVDAEVEAVDSEQLDAASSNDSAESEQAGAQETPETESDQSN